MIRPLQSLPIFLLLSGCLGGAGETPSANEPNNTEIGSLIDGQSIFGLSTYKSFVVINQNLDGVVLLARKLADLPAAEFQVRLLVDGRIVSEASRDIQFSEGQDETLVSVPTLRTDARPSVLVGECNCMLWYRKDHDATMGNVSWIEERTVNASVSYNPNRPETLLGGPPLHDSTQFFQVTQLLHWRPNYHFNLNGNFSLHTPKGRELWNIDAAGPSPTGGHLSNGSLPVHPGNWTLSMHGTGYVYLEITETYLRTDAWKKLKG